MLIRYLDTNFKSVGRFDLENIHANIASPPKANIVCVLPCAIRIQQILYSNMYNSLAFHLQSLFDITLVKTK